MMKATVKQTAGEPRQTRHGMRVSVTLDAGGKEIKVEGDPSDAALKSLPRGQKVEVFKGLDGQFHIGTDPAPAQQAETAPFQRPPRRLEDNMKDFVKWQARLYRDCREEVSNTVKDANDTDEVTRMIFQNTIRRYRI
ncbi:MAG: hypothetical protein R2830_19325 [Saprospiraceae bacterium]